jgi:hypothetical protein
MTAGVVSVVLSSLCRKIMLAGGDGPYAGFQGRLVKMVVTII